MQVSTVKKGAAALAAVLLLAILMATALPWLASTQIVRDRIAHELSIWSGYRVSLRQDPVLDVWPSFKATLNDVAFHEWEGGDNPPVLEADRLEVSMSAIAALRGDVVFSTMSIYRPLLRLTTPGPVIDLPASPGGGRMVRAVDAARELVKDNGGTSGQSSLPTNTFGTVEFFDGRITAVHGSETDIVTSISGRLVWPALDRPANLNATAIWRGENVAVELSSGRPLMLLAGGNAPVKASLKSALLETSFDGTASLAGTAYFDGDASLSSPSLRRMLEWSKTDIPPGAAIGSMSIKGRIQGNADRLRIENVSMALGADAATGVVDIAFVESIPAMSGTLAFETLDLRSFLSAFAQITPEGVDMDRLIDHGFGERLSLDLRLSANSAKVGGITLSDVAASSQIRGKLAVFDISDASAFDGSVQAGIKIDGSGESKAVEMRLMANEVDAFALAKAAGAERMMPQGRATISVILKGNGDNWNSVMSKAEGSVSATLGQGALVGIDAAKFREKWAAGGFFPLSDVAEGSLPLRGADFKATLYGGLARIDKADLLLEEQIVSIAGFVPYFGRALALSGDLAPVDGEGERGPSEARFFVGGGWDAPFVSPAIAPIVPPPADLVVPQAPASVD